MNLKSKEYYEAQRDDKMAAYKKYRDKNREKLRAYSREYNSTYREKLKASSSQYNKSHQEIKASMKRINNNVKNKGLQI